MKADPRDWLAERVAAALALRPEPQPTSARPATAQPTPTVDLRPRGNS
ncbi:hypothetical protein ACQP0U_24075 [Micromonospora sp. CA-269861]